MNLSGDNKEGRGFKAGDTVFVDSRLGAGVKVMRRAGMGSAYEPTVTLSHVYRDGAVRESIAVDGSVTTAQFTRGKSFELSNLQPAQVLQRLDRRGHYSIGFTEDGIAGYKDEGGGSRRSAVDMFLDGNPARRLLEESLRQHRDRTWLCMVWARMKSRSVFLVRANM